MKKQAKTTLQSLALVSILGGAIIGVVPTVSADNISQRITPEIRSELVRVKQSVAFAENLQIEVKHDPQDIYKGLDNSLSILDQLLASSSLNPEVRDKLKSIKSGVQKIRRNLNDTAAYTEVRGLLEPMTNNPSE